MRLREQWIRPLDALPQDYQHVIAITSSGQEEEMYLVDDKWHIVDGVRIPIEFVVFWHEKREQPTVEMAEDCISREQTLKCHYFIYDEYGNWLDVVDASDIERLPSVTPQPKRGEWIPTNDYVTTAYGSLDYYRCSCCGEDSLEEGDYCPNCGAKMDADMRKEKADGKIKITSRNPVSDILRTIMYLKGKTPEEMAKTIGVAYGTYSSRLRDGHFSIYELVALCDSCDMTITIQGEGVNIDLKEFLNDAHKKAEEVQDD